MLGGPVKRFGDGFDLLVVRGDAEAHQAEGGRQPVEDISLYRYLSLPQKMVGCVETGRAGPNNGHSQGAVRSSWITHTVYLAKNSRWWLHILDFGSGSIAKYLGMECFNFTLILVPLDSHNIANRDDADQFTLVDQGDVPDALFGHRVGYGL